MPPSPGDNNLARALYWQVTGRPDPLNRARPSDCYRRVLRRRFGERRLPAPISGAHPRSRELVKMPLFGHSQTAA